MAWIFSYVQFRSLICAHLGLRGTVRGRRRSVSLPQHRPGHHTRRLLRSRQRCRFLPRRRFDLPVRSRSDLLRLCSGFHCLAGCFLHLPEGLFIDVDDMELMHTFRWFHYWISLKLNCERRHYLGSDQNNQNITKVALIRGGLNTFCDPKSLRKNCKPTLPQKCLTYSNFLKAGPDWSSRLLGMTLTTEIRSM